MKHRVTIVLVLVLILTQAGCQSGKTAEQAAPSSAGTKATVAQPGTDVRTLAMGTLGLDGSEHAVDAAQAAELLPLWKAYRSLIKSDATAPAELLAVLQQISESMTQAQHDAMIASTQDAEAQGALAARFGLEMPASGAGQGRGVPEGMTEEELQALRAERQAAAAVAGTVPGEGVPGTGGGFGMGRGGGVPPTGAEGFVDPGVQAAAGGGASIQAGAGSWVSNLVEAVISYLEERQQSE